MATQGIVSLIVDGKVYAHEICYCRYESGWSVHRIYASRLSALKAMLKHRRVGFQEQLDRRILAGKVRGEEITRGYDLDRVREYEVAI